MEKEKLLKTIAEAGRLVRDAEEAIQGFKEEGNKEAAEYVEGRKEFYLKQLKEASATLYDEYYRI